jgi:hypothetical protein
MMLLVGEESLDEWDFMPIYPDVEVINQNTLRFNRLQPETVGDRKLILISSIRFVMIEQPNNLSSWQHIIHSNQTSLQYPWEISVSAHRIIAQQTPAATPRWTSFGAESRSSGASHNIATRV